MTILPPLPAPRPAPRALPALPLLILSLATALAAQAPVNASGGPLVPEQAAYDVDHYRLEIRVDPDSRSIEGRLAMTADLVHATRRILMDLDPALEVREVLLDGAAVAIAREGGRLAVPLAADGAAEPGRRFTVSIAYGGTPRVAPNPPWKGGFTWAKTRDGRPWIATTCQGEGADLWWPCKDHPSDKPATMDLFVTVPAGLVCASNGVLRSTKENEDRSRTFHWHVSQPISNYNVALNIAPYEVIETTYESVTGEKVPVSFWVRPESRKQGEKALPEFLDHLRWFEETCGPYPFRNEKYGIVETPHLGMEHQTIIAYGNKFRKLQWNYDWLHHHELAHEWWANLVTCRDWKDMWIHEGIGTYMQPLYIEKLRGPKAYAIEMAQKRRTLNNRRPVAPRESQTSKEIYFGEGGGTDTDIYYKGAWIMHSLRWLLGDAVFFQALRRLAYPDPAKEKVTDGSQVRFSDTEEVRRIVEKVAGKDLGWFFDVYLRQPALPRLESHRKGGRLHLRWVVPYGLEFPMPVAVVIGGEARRVAMPGGRAVLEVDGKAEVALDPENRILREGNRLR